MRSGPFRKLVEPTTLVKRLKVGRLAEAHPRVNDGQERSHIARAHEVQPVGLDAVVNVDPEHLRAVAKGYLITIVERIPIGELPHQVLLWDWTTASASCNVGTAKSVPCSMISKLLEYVPGSEADGRLR